MFLSNDDEINCFSLSLTFNARESSQPATLASYLALENADIMRLNTDVKRLATVALASCVQLRSP